MNTCREYIACVRAWAYVMRGAYAELRATAMPIQDATRTVSVYIAYTVGMMCGYPLSADPGQRTGYSRAQDSGVTTHGAKSPSEKM